MGIPLTEEQRQRNREACAKWYKNNKEKAKKAYRRYAASDWGKYAMREVNRRSRAKNLECSITADWLNKQLEPMICQATGIQLVWTGPDRQNPWAPSVDKVDPLGGYTPDNVQVVCWAYNWAKGNWDPEVLSTLARAIIAKEK